MPGAIVELEQAVKLDPDMARNHTNLAAAYYASGDKEKGWYHVRQSVRCKYDDGIAKPQFVSLCKEKLVRTGLNKPGTSWEEIKKNLGEPDVHQEDENGHITFCEYGTCKIYFSNGLLTRWTLM